jgi:hypothetical protein
MDQLMRMGALALARVRVVVPGLQVKKGRWHVGRRES